MKEKSGRIRGERDQIKFIDLRFEKFIIVFIKKSSMLAVLQFGKRLHVDVGTHFFLAFRDVALCSL